MNDYYPPDVQLDQNHQENENVEREKGEEILSFKIQPCKQEQIGKTNGDIEACEQMDVSLVERHDPHLQLLGFDSIAEL